MRYKAILFDLDGTLLPMDLEKFVAVYFASLARKAAELGLPVERFMSALQEGTKAMIVNDGQTTNAELFWHRFAGILGQETDSVEAAFDVYYAHEFMETKAATWPNPMAVQLVKAARKQADKVILATNPLFPLCAVETRLSWNGLSAADFDDITYYQNSRYCKPNPKYFTEIFQRHGLSPTDCLMVGNDLKEDGSAASLGAEVFILSDCLITHGLSPQKFTCGTAEELLHKLAQTE